jgi:uncharacterized protein YjbI with pentapeptide repeats
MKGSANLVIMGICVLTGTACAQAVYSVDAIRQFGSQEIGCRKPQQTINAGTVRRKLLAGNGVDIKNTLIEGDLNVSNCDINKPVKFTDCWFTGQVNLSFVKFEKLFSATHSTFLHGITCRHSTFAEGLSFDNSRITGEAVLSDDTTNIYTADFRNMVSQRFASFKHAILTESNFQQASINTRADFRGAVFLGQTIFTAAHFQGLILFRADFREGSERIRGPIFYGTRNSRAQTSKVSFSVRAQFSLAKLTSMT